MEIGSVCDCAWRPEHEGKSFLTDHAERHDDAKMRSLCEHGAAYAREGLAYRLRPEDVVSIDVMRCAGAGPLHDSRSTGGQGDGSSSS